MLVASPTGSASIYTGQLLQATVGLILTAEDLLNSSVDKRLSGSQIREHRWFQEQQHGPFDWEELSCWDLFMGLGAFPCSWWFPLVSIAKVNRTLHWERRGGLAWSVSLRKWQHDASTSEIRKAPGQGRCQGHGVPPHGCWSAISTGRITWRKSTAFWMKLFRKATHHCHHGGYSNEPINNGVSPLSGSEWAGLLDQRLRFDHRATQSKHHPTSCHFIAENPLALKMVWPVDGLVRVNECQWHSMTIWWI